MLNLIKSKYPDLFVYMKSEVVHPHDYFISRLILRYLPESLTPNRITLIRIALTPLVVFLILFQNYILGIILFLAVAFTDAMDGSLARTKNKITKLGILLDPLADKLLIGSMVLILVLKYYPIWLGLTILGLEVVFIVSALATNLKFKTVRMANNWGKIKMILQVLAVFLTLIALVWNIPHLFTVAAWLFGLAIGFALVSLFAHGI